MRNIAGCIDGCADTGHNMDMTTTAAIGTCLWAGHKIRAEVKPATTYTPCPACTPVGTQRSMVKWTLKARVTTSECDGACRSAKSDSCSCECGGRNHGASLRAA